MPDFTFARPSATDLATLCVMGVSIVPLVALRVAVAVALMHLLPVDVELAEAVFPRFFFGLVVMSGGSFKQCRLGKETLYQSELIHGIFHLVDRLTKGGSMLEPFAIPRNMLAGDSHATVFAIELMASGKMSHQRRSNFIQ